MLDGTETYSIIADGFFDLFASWSKMHGRSWILYDVNQQSGQKKKTGNITVKEPPSPELWEEHLTGKGKGLGLFPLLDDNTVLFAAIDIDDCNIDHDELESRVKKLGLPLVICRSKSGGAHCYLLFSERANAEKVQNILGRWAAALGYPGCEIFPKQSHRVNDDDAGNWINMPYYQANTTGNRRCRHDGRWIEDPNEFLTFARSSQTTLDAVAAIWVPEVVEEPRQKSSKDHDPVTMAELRRTLSYVNPTFPGKYNQWMGICKAILDTEIQGDASRDDRWNAVDDWCKGALWNLRTGDGLVVESYRGREHLEREIREKGCRKEPASYGTICHFAKENGWAAPRKASGKKRIEFITYADVDKIVPPPHLIDNFVSRYALVVAYGAPNAGKSFIALDIAFHIATGRPWLGREVEQGYVCYVAGEAPYGLSIRLRALKQQHKIDDVPLDIMKTSVDLCDPEGDTSIVIEAIREQAAGRPVGMVVIDTLSSVFGGGNENGPEDMGSFIDNCRRIRDELSTTVLVIHHEGKDKTKGGRGHSKLYGDFDIELVVSDKSDDRNKISALVVKKNRDIEKTGEEFLWERRVVEVGLDAKNKVVTSCILVPKDNEEQKKPRIDVRGKNVQLILEILNDWGVGKEFKRDDVRKEFMARYVTPDGSTQKNKSDAFVTAWNSMRGLKEGVVSPTHDVVTLTDALYDA